MNRKKTKDSCGSAIIKLIRVTLLLGSSNSQMNSSSGSQRRRVRRQASSHTLTALAVVWARASALGEEDVTR